MGTYGTVQNVMQLWELEKLTPEQTIGQLLQLLTQFEERLRELETRVSRANGAGQGDRGRIDGRGCPASWRRLRDIE